MQSDRPLRVLMLTSGDRTPSTRFRVLPFLQHLHAARISATVAESFPQKYDYFPWLGFRPSQKLKRCVRWAHWLYACVRRFDVIFVERELFDNDTVDLELRFRKLARRMVLDLDDAVFLRFPDKIDRLAKLADTVIAGNSWIARWVIERNPNCVIIPTGVQLANFPLRPPRDRSATPVIGWIGTIGNLGYLQVVAPALRELARKTRFEFHVVVPEFTLPSNVDLTGVSCRHIVWNGSTELASLHAFDIGIMPLFCDREWDRFKCPTKLIQYMAIGIPSVATPVGFTGDVLQSGIDGFYAANDQQWQARLEILLQDESLRNRMGAAAREKVARDYCVESNWPLLAKAIEGDGSVST